jgi:hypothetical protein
LAKINDDVSVQIAKLHAEGLSQREIGKQLGLGKSTVGDHVRAVLKDGSFPAPTGHFTKATSTLYDADGNLKLQWVKSSLDQEAHEAAKKVALEALAESIPRAAPVEPAPMLLDLDLLSAYVIGDAHFGLLAWGEETGTPFDIAIAEKELRGAVSYLVNTAPASKYGMLVNVGDFLHANSRKPTTPTSGNVLDVDSRFLKAARAAVKVLRYATEAMLLKHEKVFIVNAPGNHDPDAATWLSLTLAMFYENEPRVEVDQHPGAVFYRRHGKCLIGVTHGDTVKFDQLASIMACDRPKEWGETEHRHFLTGHIHHTKQQEYRGVFAESFNTLAAGDAWHRSSGYRATRQMQRLDFHQEYGVISRFICNIGMLKAE